MRTIFPILSLILFVFSACTGEDPRPNESMYFPPISGSDWEKTSISSLNWDESKLPDLLDFLESRNTKSFLILVNGRIVLEEYFDGHTPETPWQWNSAGKTLVTATTGIAQQEGILDIHAPISDYFGTGWTLLPSEKESLITSRHLLTMTSGINDESQLVIKPNFTYLANAGARWSYHNIFQKLTDVVSAASGRLFDVYFDIKLKNKIGMDGFWNNGLIFKVYHSTARSMARFGILALNNGRWEEDQMIDEEFFTESISTSQNLNPSYGYLWWLNGKTQYMLPGSQSTFSGPLLPAAPADLYAAMGAEDQRLYVIPSKKMVIIRMGKTSNPLNPNFALSGFDEALWTKINAVIR